jgi:hypothetical protein
VFEGTLEQARLAASGAQGARRIRQKLVGQFGSGSHHKLERKRKAPVAWGLGGFQVLGTILMVSGAHAEHAGVGHRHDAVRKRLLTWRNFYLRVAFGLFPRGRLFPKC